MRGLITTCQKRLSAATIERTHSNSFDLSPPLVTFQVGRCSQTFRSPIPSTCPFSLLRACRLPWRNDSGWVDQNSKRQCHYLGDISISCKQLINKEIYLLSLDLNFELVPSSCSVAFWQVRDGAVSRGLPSSSTSASVGVNRE